MTVAKYHDGVTWRTIPALTGPQGPQGAQGPKGDTGAQGPQGPMFSIPVVSALPSSPAHGTEVYLQPNASPWPLWHFRYDAGWGGTDKWECLGGEPIEVRDDNDRSYSSTGGWSATTANLDYTTPMQASWDVWHFATLWCTVAGGFQAGTGFGATLPSAFWQQSMAYSAANITTSLGAVARSPMLATGTVLRHYVLAPNGGTAHPRGRVIRVMPVRAIG